MLSLHERLNLLLVDPNHGRDSGRGLGGEPDHDVGVGVGLDHRWSLDELLACADATMEGIRDMYDHGRAGYEVHVRQFFSQHVPRAAKVLLERSSRKRARSDVEGPGQPHARRQRTDPGTIADEELLYMTCAGCRRPLMRREACYTRPGRFADCDDVVCLACLTRFSMPSACKCCGVRCTDVSALCASCTLPTLRRMPLTVRRTPAIPLAAGMVYIGGARRNAKEGWSVRASRWDPPFVWPRGHVGKKERRLVIPTVVFDAACTLYEQYVRSRPELMAAVPFLANKALVCWCDHKVTCHGHVLLKLAAEYIQTRNR